MSGPMKWQIHTSAPVLTGRQGRQNSQIREEHTTLLRTSGSHIKEFRRCWLQVRHSHVWLPYSHDTGQPGSWPLDTSQSLRFPKVHPGISVTKMMLSFSWVHGPHEEQRFATCFLGIIASVLQYSCVALKLDWRGCCNRSGSALSIVVSEESLYRKTRGFSLFLESENEKD